MTVGACSHEPGGFQYDNIVWLDSLVEVISVLFLKCKINKLLQSLRIDSALRV